MCVCALPNTVNDTDQHSNAAVELNEQQRHASSREEDRRLFASLLAQARLFASLHASLLRLLARHLTHYSPPCSPPCSLARSGPTSPTGARRWRQKVQVGDGRGRIGMTHDLLFSQRTRDKGHLSIADPRRTLVMRMLVHKHHSSIYPHAPPCASMSIVTKGHLSH